MEETICIQNGTSISLQGATKVLSATQNQAIVETEQNTVIISGSEIEVKKLDLDNKEVSFTGKISNVKLSTSQASRVPFWKRIFK